MAFSPEVQAKVHLWRQKARDGTLTQDEMREAIVALRGDRTAAHATSAKAKAGRKKPVNSDDLLAELDGLAGLEGGNT